MILGSRRRHKKEAGGGGGERFFLEKAADADADADAGLDAIKEPGAHKRRFNG